LDEVVPPVENMKLVFFEITERQKVYEGKLQVRLGHHPLFFFLTSPPRSSHIKIATIRQANMNTSHLTHPCC
jgi:hypothetical protein